jgi:hypothetical protein
VVANTVFPETAAEPSAPPSPVSYVRSGLQVFAPHPAARNAMRWKLVLTPSPNSVPGVV